MIVTKLFLRLAIAAGFLSAVADRLGFWPEAASVWGNWERFLEYTRLLNPWCPESFINLLGVVATSTEVLFALFLLIGYKTELIAKLSGFLLLLFALAMMTTIGLKSVLDYSVFIASAASFALSTIKIKYAEVDLRLN